MSDVIPVNADRYEAAMTELLGLMELQQERKLTWPEVDRLELLAVCIEHYEDRRYPWRLPTAIDAVKFRMEEGRLTEKEVGRHVGGPARLRKLLAGEIQMNVNDVRAFHFVFGVPLGPLIYGGELARWVHC